MLKLLAIMLAAALGLSGPAGPEAPPADQSSVADAVDLSSLLKLHLNKETPYAPAGDEIKAPPSGYSMFFIETMGRHGSRAETSDDEEQPVLDLWEEASAAGALTDLGSKLADDVKTFQTVEEKLGYGNLSTRGKAEWKDIGERTATNYANFFEALESEQEELSFVTTDRYRTKQSTSALRSGLTAKFPDLTLGPPFEEEAYVNFDSDMGDQGENDYEAVLDSPDVVDAATNTLKRVYTDSFVDSLSNPVGKALDIYGLYGTAAGLSHDTKITFKRYFDEQDLPLLSYADDAKGFYKYGPGVEGETDSYEGAQVLLDAFFQALDERIAGGTTATVFRIAHGETTIPFAALLQLPGSEKPATPGVPFTYDSNPWRGHNAGILAGSVEWVAYRDAQQNVIVTMRHNEKPVKFRAGCDPITQGSYFYAPDELKSCLPAS